MASRNLVLGVVWVAVLCLFFEDFAQLLKSSCSSTGLAVSILSCQTWPAAFVDMHLWKHLTDIKRNGPYRRNMNCTPDLSRPVGCMRVYSSAASRSVWYIWRYVYGGEDRMSTVLKTAHEVVIVLIVCGWTFQFIIFQRMKHPAVMYVWLK